jgi:hypothetical protein
MNFFFHRQILACGYKNENLQANFRDMTFFFSVSSSLQTRTASYPQELCGEMCQYVSWNDYQPANLNVTCLVQFQNYLHKIVYVYVQYHVIENPFVIHVFVAVSELLFLFRCWNSVELFINVNKKCQQKEFLYHRDHLGLQ